MRSLGREGLLAAICTRLRGRESVVLSGPRGIGRTWAARLVQDHLEEAGVEVVLVAGSVGAAGIPLAPFAAAIATYVGDDPSPLAAYSTLPVRLAAAGTVVVVDDAPLLDQASAVLVGQLGRAGVAVLVTTAELTALSRAVQDSVGRGRVHHVELPRLDADAVLLLAVEIAGGELGPVSGARLLARADGVPGLVVALLGAGLAGGGRDQVFVVHRPGRPDMAEKTAPPRQGAQVPGVLRRAGGRPAVVETTPAE